MRGPGGKRAEAAGLMGCAETLGLRLAQQIHVDLTRLTPREDPVKTANELS